MLGLNKTSTEYTIKLLLYKSRPNDKGVQTFDIAPRTFYGNYMSSDDINRLGLNQGVQATTVYIETDTQLSLVANDKIVLNGKNYFIKSTREENNPLSGSRFTNKPASIKKYIVAD